MIVKVYAVNQDSGEQSFLHHSELQDCFPDDETREEHFAAQNEIRKSGRAWIGGGAAPLFLLMAI